MSVSRSEYMKARKNAQARYNRLVNKGYGFNTNPIPAIPKKITEASIRRLNKLTARELRDKASYGVIQSSGEVTTVKQAYISERRETYRRQSEAQKEAQKIIKAEREYAELVLKRPKNKGETHREYYERAKEQHERELEEWKKDIAESTYTEEEDTSYYDWVPDNDKGDYDNYSENDFYNEIEDAYANEDYDRARELEKERDKRFPPNGEDIAHVSWADRFQDAIDEMRKFSPDLASKLQEAIDYYLDMHKNDAYPEDMMDINAEDLETALDKIEDAKYRGNEYAIWEVYSKLDKTINGRHHPNAEKNVFFGKIQSGDFNYE